MAAIFRTDDIFFLEVCIYNFLCTNGDQVFSLAVGEGFQCELSPQRFEMLREVLASGVSDQNEAYRPDGMKRCRNWCNPHTCDTGDCVGCGSNHGCSGRDD